MTTPIIGLGAGGHAKVVIEILRLSNNYELVGLLDSRQELWNTELLGIPVIGDDSLLAELNKRGINYAFIGLGTIGDTRPRRRLYEKARRQGFQIANVIHPQAVIAPSVIIGYGSTIMAGVVINAAAQLGDNVIINTSAVVEHDCVISNHVHIATGARLASGVHVGEGTHIGLGSSILQCIHIGCNAIIGTGAVVVDDVPDNVTVTGIPARILKKVAI
ncbi:acetyltransferase [Chloroflexota bacterium]